MSDAKHKGHRYNWEYWFGHSEITLKKNVDYDCLDHGFGQYTRRAAKRYGYLVSVAVGEGQITITVHGRTEPKPEVHENKYRGKK